MGLLFKKNSSVGINRSLEGDDAYVTDVIDITYPRHMSLVNGFIKDRGLSPMIEA